jgi:Mn2+/Fe2+ NRAMP family transporter
MSFNVIILLFNNSYYVNFDKMFFLLLILVILSIIFKIFYINIRLDLVNKTINIIKKAT